MLESNAAVVCRLIEEVINGGQTQLLTELVAGDDVGHGPFGDHYGVEGMRIALSEYQAAFRDFRVTLQDRVSEGEKIAHRFSIAGTHTGPFLGIPPTGRPVSAVGIVIDRVVNGKVAESWISLDALHLLRQLGATPVLRRHAEQMSLETAPPILEEIDSFPGT